MNIELINNQSANRVMDVDKNQYSTHTFDDSRMKAGGLGYSLDISGKVRENAAYGKEELKSVQEVAQTAGMQNVQLNRDYMAVMSNSMSSEDFAHLTEDGVNPTKTEVSESVTNLDKIKLTMAEAGITITGFNDDLSSEDYKAGAGNEGVAKAAKIAKELEPITEEAAIYIIQNNLEPTINNVYKAEHVTAGVSSISANNNANVTYSGVAAYANKAQTDNAWEDLEAQAEVIVENAGVDSNEGMKAAKSLVEHQVPFNEESLTKYVELTTNELPTDDNDILKVIENAIVDGKEPMDANLFERENIYEKAVRIKNEFANMTLDDIVARRKLEEVRLVMTSEANLTLLRQGINIDTTDLEELVDLLKEAERQFYAPLLLDEDGKTELSEELNEDGVNENVVDNTRNAVDNAGIAPKKYTISDLSDDDKAELDLKIDLYKATSKIVSDIPNVPVETVAKVAYNSEANDFTKPFNLENLANEGDISRQAYEKAGQTYEALMTAPRGDLGDSIKKAFSNVDDILADLDLDINDTNRKAVRTLGYANMEINKESIEAIREVSSTVSRVISLMTPAKVLDMIRRGENPLNENIYDLEKSLSEETPEESIVKYSKYLLELEQKGNITEEEKSAYIGMFRLFNLIEKQDGRVIGNVLSNGQELTMQNMLSASRSNRHKNMDVKIDDDFGLLEDLISRDDSVSEQISRGFANIIAAPVNKVYVNDELKNVKKAAKADPFNSQVLESIGEPVSVENVLAMEDMISSFDKSTRKLFSKDNDSKKDEDEALEEAQTALTDDDISELIDKFDERLAAREAYGKYLDKAKEVALTNATASDSYIDVKEWALVHKQLGFASSMGRNDTYEIPVKTKDGYTSMHLTIKHGENAGGKIVATMQSEEYGKITAKFKVGADGVDGFIVSDSRAGLDNVKAKKADIINEMSNAGMDTKAISFVFGTVSKTEDYIGDALENEKVSDNQLYKVAKAFVVAVSR